MDWTEEYRPTSLKAVKGNEPALQDLERWADTWDEHREAIILHGAPGIGKTTAAHALANDMGWDAMEMNASDSRTGDIIDRIAGEASKTGTLTAAGTSGRRLVILDEADNLHGHKDRGGARAMTDVVKQANQPIVLIANEFYDMSNGLRNACQDIEFEAVPVGLIMGHLAFICDEEGVSYEKEGLKLLAEKAKGDVRSAINDLQAVASNADHIDKEDIITGGRDRKEDIFSFLDAVLQDGDPSEMAALGRRVDETPDDLIMWIEHNAPKALDADELAEAYDHLSRADRWLGRVLATQEYSYWRYASDNMTAGVAAARNRDHGGWTRFGAPYGRYYGGGSGTREEVARKVAEESGVSIDSAKRDILPLLAAMTHHCKPRELTVAMAARYEMDEGEVSAITGSGKTTNKVEGIVEEAKELRSQFDIGGGDADVNDEEEWEAEPESETAVEDDGDVSEDDEVETDSEDGGDDDDDDGSTQSGLTDFI